MLALWLDILRLAKKIIKRVEFLVAYGYNIPLV
jgi:hypothetical protein